MAFLNETGLRRVLNGLKNVFEGKADLAVATSVTLLSSGWSNTTPPTQTVNVTGMTTTTKFFIGAGGITQSQLEEMVAAELQCTAQGTGTLTITCNGEVPANDLPVNVILVS